MKKILFLFLSIFALSACDNKEKININCGNYDILINMSEDGESLKTIVNGNIVNLNIAMSASGVRYVGKMDGEDITLWNKGIEWTLYLKDGLPIMCTSK